MRYLFKNRILTIPVIIFIGMGIVSAVVWRLSIKYVLAADFFTDTVSFAMRFILTKATYFIPFSLAELILYSVFPVTLFLAVKDIIKNRRVRFQWKREMERILRFLFRAAAFAGIMLFVFSFNLGVCYGRTPVSEKMGFERRLLSVEDLYTSMEILTDELNKVSENIKYIYSDTGSTKMPYGLNDMNKKLNQSYKNMLDRHDLFKRIDSRVKPVILSEQMSKMHITGIYMPFTGEANVNIDFPDYNLPKTAAHEMAHLMGIAREDEANFVAFLVCLYSGDDYIKYSGLVNMVEYIGNALYGADKEKYFEIMNLMPEIVINEMAAFSRFFDKYRDAPASKVASAANNAYLKAQGQEQGTKSYGLVVDLAVVYLLDIYEK